jgi:eukaryotic-like serine/threonine-protein kinase
MSGEREPGEPAAGDRLAAGYTIDSPISRGAMGAVYRARSDDGREVAVKRLVDTRQAARFEIEARLLARLKHPRIANVLDHFQDPSGSYLVMELVRGSDLGELVVTKGAPGLPVDRAVDYAIQACEALQYVHDEQVLHRDVKPRNLILDDAGIVLVDFGVARELDADDPGTRAVGTPQYMAPEVLVGESISPRSDVFGIAATLWTLLTGKPPAYDDRTRLADRFPGVTPALEETLRAGLALHPERRIASAEAFARALGSPLGPSAGASLALSVEGASGGRTLIESFVRTAAAVFEAAAASLAVTEGRTGELVYRAAWGAGAEEVVGVRLPAGSGIAGAVVADREGIAVPNCRDDPRFAVRIAEGTGYVPYTMLVVPLVRDGEAIGALSVLDRRDGRAYGAADLERAQQFADLTVEAVTAGGVPL